MSLGPEASRLTEALQVVPVIVTGPTIAAAVLTFTTGVTPASTVPDRTWSSLLVGVETAFRARAGGVVSRAMASVSVVMMPAASVLVIVMLLFPSTSPLRVALQVMAEGESAGTAGPLLTWVRMVAPASLVPL